MAVPVKQYLDALFGVNNDWRVKLVREWPTIIGPLSQRVCLQKISENTLILGVYDVHWMQELYILSRTIIKTINRALGDDLVMELKFKLIQKNDREVKSLDTSQKKRTIERLLTSREERALNSIVDENLREALCAFLVRSKE